jgi:multidrug resistance protein
MLVVFLTIFLDLVGFGIVLPLLPRFAAAHHAQEWQIGLLMASYSLMQFFFAPVWGRLSDRIGRRPVLLFSITGSAVSYLIFAFAPNLAALFLARIVAGIMAANLSTAQAYVADVTTPENRARGMGMVGAAFALGFVLGPALGGVLGGHGNNPQLPVGLAAAGFSLLDLLLAAVLLRESLTPERRARAAAAPGSRLERMAAALRHPKIGLPILVFFLSTVAWSQLEPTLARLAQIDFLFSARQTGYLFAYLGLIVALVQGGFAGRMARKSGEARMILAGTLLLALGLALIPLMRHPGGLFASVTVAALGQAITVPGIQSLISRSAAAEEQGTTLGVTQGFASLARVIGPSIGGLLFGLRHAYPFWFGAALMVAGFLLALRIASVSRS